MIDWNELFTYKDGKLFNKVKRGRSGIIGSEVGNNKANIVRINQVSHKVHRIIWEMHHGSIPIGMTVDHIDRDRSNNRLDNLRVCSLRDNCQNRKGLGYEKRGNKYHAYIGQDGKKKSLGVYPNPYEAHGAYLEAKKELCGKYAPQ